MITVLKVASNSYTLICIWAKPYINLVFTCKFKQILVINHIHDTHCLHKGCWGLIKLYPCVKLKEADIRVTFLIHISSTVSFNFLLYLILEFTFKQSILALLCAKLCFLSEFQNSIQMVESRLFFAMQNSFSLLSLFIVLFIGFSYQTLQVTFDTHQLSGCFIKCQVFWRYIDSWVPNSLKWPINMFWH